VIPNGINQERFSATDTDSRLRKELNLEDKLVLGFTGFVREWHRLDRVVSLLNTIEKQRPRHLLLVGDGPSCDLIKRKAMELGVLDKVTITGIVPREKIATYVSCFDIALQPDVVEYASPLKLFEYLALGRAIVAPDTPNIREVLENGRNSILFNPEEESSFLDAVERLCNEPLLRKKIAIEARKTVTEGGYTWDNNARRVEEIFGLLIAKRSSKLPS
jgi:glycosyltransferase involved in cell wall biosynthesis